MLKVPHTPEAGRREIELITTWSPRGISPEPQAYDPRTGSYLVERVRPGGEWIPPSGAVGAGEFVRVLDLAHLTDDHSQGSHLLTDRELLSMRATWAHEHATAANSAGLHSLITSAQALADVALEHTTNRILVHGDLAAKNLLRGRDGPQIIDPMPAIGEREFDAALWAANQDGDTIFERIRQLWDLGFDYPKLLTWTSVLAALELRIGQRHSARQAEFLRDETVTEMLQLDEQALDALDGIRLCTHQR